MCHTSTYTHVRRYTDTQTHDLSLSSSPKGRTALKMAFDTANFKSSRTFQNICLLYLILVAYLLCLSTVVFVVIGQPAPRSTPSLGRERPFILFVYPLHVVLLLYLAPSVKRRHTVNPSFSVLRSITRIDRCSRVFNPVSTRAHCTCIYSASPHLSPLSSSGLL